MKRITPSDIGFYCFVGLLLTTLVAVPVWVFSAVDKSEKRRELIINKTLQEAQQFVGSTASSFAEKYGAPYKIYEVDNVKFYMFVINNTNITITTKDGIILKVENK